MNIERMRDRFFQGVPRYRYVQTIGRGGMGVVFKAVDLELDDEVAIKVLAPDLDADDQELLTRFKREIQLNRKIKHPNVARIHDFGTSGDYAYITMEFIPGVDLRTLIQREGKLSPDRALAILRQIALGTEAAHKLGIVHRDLKSQNVMVEESGAVAILDFGLARGKLNENLTLDSVMIGTPHYMPPEQALGKRTDARSDIYSIGVMAFECMTGRVPFTGETPLVIAMKQVNEGVPAHLLKQANVPEELVEIILKALAKAPEDRIPSAAALETEFSLVQTGARAQPEPEAEPAPEPAPPPQTEQAPPPTVVVPLTPRERTAVSARSAPHVTPPTIHPSKLPREERQMQLDRNASGTRIPIIKEREPIVLIVDQDPAQRAWIKQELSSRRCKTIEAGKGQVAIELLFRNQVDLILIDLSLPDMDGFDVTRVIKSQPTTAPVPIVLMSARLDRNRYAFGIQSGATDMLQKPLDLKSAAVRIWSILQHRGFVPPEEISGDLQVQRAELRARGFV